jgi:hypothetical protein
MGLRKIAAVLFSALLGIAATAAASNSGVAVRGGDEVQGVIAPSTDVDSFLINLPQGGGLTIKVADEKSGLLPAVSLRDPDGNLVDLSGKVRGVGKAKISLKNLPIDETGVWQISIGSTGGTTGTYRARFTIKYPRSIRVKGSIVAGGGTRKFPVPGMDGATLGFVLKQKAGPPLAGARVLDPVDDEIPAPEGSIVHKGMKWSGKKIPLARGFGEYGVEAHAAPGPDAVVDAIVTVKAPKGAKRTLALALEPRPTDSNPETGRDGVAVHVTGTNFAEGAQVWFGDVQAEDAIVVSSGQIDCSAPYSEDSDDGAAVEIRVVNPDGQENAMGKTFKFHGIPAPASVNPFYAPLAGGTTLTIVGKNFRTNTDPPFVVTVGGIEAGDLNILGAGSLSCTAPDVGEEGVVAVVVTDEYGRSGTMAAGPRYVGAPTLNGASPSSSSFVGGRLINVTGSGFRASVSVLIDGEAAESVEYVSPSVLRFPMPAGPAGALDVQVADEFGQASAVSEGLLHRRGPFVSRTDTAVPAAPEGNDFRANTLGLGDLDGDGDLDLVVAARWPYYVYDSYTYTGSYLPASFVLMNDGAGAFSDESASRHATFGYLGDYGQAGALVMGDLDGDSAPETALFAPYPISGPPSLFYVGTNSYGPVYGFYAYTYTGYYGTYYFMDTPTNPAGRLLANDGSGHLTHDVDALPWISTPMQWAGERWQASAAAMGDLDGDGSLDLVLTAGGPVQVGTISSVGYAANYYYGYGSYNCYVYYQSGGYVPATRILTNDGSGGLAPTATLPGTTYFPNGYPAESFEGNALALGDLDGDGALDIVVARGYPNYYYTYSYYGGGGYSLPATRVLRNDGSGAAFSALASAMPAPYGATPQGAYSYEYWQADALALGDLDGDGDLDLVMGRHTAYYWTDTSYTTQLLPAIRVFRNDGSGHFAEATGSFLASSSFQGHSTDTILGVTSIQIGDLDGDGSPDLLVSGGIAGQYDYNGTGYGYNGIIPAGYRSATRVLVNNGTGLFVDQTEEWMPDYVNGDYFTGSALGLGDLDGDGDVDVVVGFEYYPFAPSTSGTNRPLRVLSTE